MAGAVLAAVKVDVCQTELRSYERPFIRPDAALLRVEACGVGGSDPELYRWPGHAPVIMGHEAVGTIEEIGDLARERWGVGPGERVALEEYLPCWHCAWCRQGDFRLCETADFFLVKDRFKTPRFGMSDCRVPPHLWGGYAQYMYLPFNSVVHRLPQDMPADLATLAIPFGNGFQWAVLDGGAGPGKSVAVFGPGQQGLGAVFAAKCAGAVRVILIGHTRDRARLDIGLGLGADWVIDAQAESVPDRIRELTHGRGVDVVVDTTGDPLGEVATTAIAIAAKGATLNLNGLSQQVKVDDIKRHFLAVRAPRGHSYRSIELALSYAQARASLLAPVCTHTFGLAEVDLAIKATAGREIDHAVHVVVDPWK